MHVQGPQQEQGREVAAQPQPARDSSDLPSAAAKLPEQGRPSQKVALTKDSSSLSPAHS
jgi:hypothetical protein